MRLEILDVLQRCLACAATLRRWVLTLALFCAAVTPAQARLDAIEIVARAPFAEGKSYGAAGPYEKLILRARFSVDPAQNSVVADIAHVRKDAAGRVTFDADVVVLQPSNASSASGAALIEPMNRGITQLLILLQSTNAPVGKAEDAALAGDGLLLNQGHAVIFAGWQHLPGAGPLADGRLAARLPVAAVGGIARHEFEAEGEGPQTTTKLEAGTCAVDPKGQGAKLGLRVSSTEVRWLPRSAWSFSAAGKPDPCSVNLAGGMQPEQIYVLLYRPEPPVVAGLGLAGLRDIAAALKSGEKLGPIHRVSRVLGYGYSQSARLLRQFVEDGFNSDASGKRAFDGLFVAAAGAGGASVNHRFAQPGVAGNSVTSFHRAVDLFPFADAGQADPLTRSAAAGKLDRARAAGVVPKVMHVFTSTEYWARAGSLLHTSADGKQDLPLPPETRLYLIAGSPHSGAPFPPVREARGNSYANFISDGRHKIWPMRALLVALDRWVAEGLEPPPSIYPKVADGTLVPLQRWRFPQSRGSAPTYLPGVWRMDMGPQFARERIIDREPPKLGREYVILVPTVDADGNEVSGIRMPSVAAPLAAWTGWNLNLPSRANIRVLGGLAGSVFPFSTTEIASRYSDRNAYLAHVRAITTELASRGFVLAEDAAHIDVRANSEWEQFSKPEQSST